MRSYRAAILLVCVLIAPADLIAQGTPPCSHPILSSVAFLEGSWRIQSSARLSANPNDWEHGSATATIEPVMRRCAFIERYTGTRRGQPFEALRVFSATAAGVGLSVVIADSEHGPLFIFEGGPDSTGLAFHTTVATPAGQVRLRLRFLDIGSHSFVTESQRSVDNGKTWDTTGRAEYRRNAR